MLERRIVELWLFFVLNESLRLHFASFPVNTALVDKLRRFTMETLADSVTVIVHSCRKMERMCSSAKAVSRSTSIAPYWANENRAVLSKSLIWICIIMFPLVLGQSLHADKSEYCTLSDNLDSASVRRKYFEIGFGSVPVPRGQVAGCIMLFSTPVEMETKYADCPVFLKSITYSYP